jgi:hypothetical protein
MQLNLLLSAFCFALICPIFAQKDTSFVTVKQETGSFEPERFIDAYDYVFMTQEPTRFMMKWNAIKLLPRVEQDLITSGGSEGPQDLRIDLGGEIKLNNASSLNLSVDAAILSGTEWINDINIHIEPRWYYEQSKRIKKGKSASNLTGNYLSSDIVLNFYKFRGDYNSVVYKNPKISARWGAQRRIFQRGYIDYSIGGGVSSVTKIVINNGYIESSQSFNPIFDLKLGLGLALTKPKHSKKDRRTCDFTKCYVEENQLVKIDLFNLIQSLTNIQQAGRFTAAYERKIGWSNWSINSEIGFYARHFKATYGYLGINVYETAGFGGKVAVEPRFYYNLKKRIAKGKTGNNLSGTYFAGHLSFSNGNSFVDQDDVYDYPVKFNTRTFVLAPMWGFQYRIFGKAFIDYKFGAGLVSTNQSIYYKLGQSYNYGWSPSFGVVSELKIGILLN